MPAATATVGLLVGNELVCSPARVIELGPQGGLFELEDAALPGRSSGDSVVCALGSDRQVVIIARREHEPGPGLVLVSFPSLDGEDRAALAAWPGTG